MRFKPTYIAQMSCILVVLLSLGCKEKASQNTGNKQEIPPSSTDAAKKNPEEEQKKKTNETNKQQPGEDPFAALVLKDAKSPTLIFGSNPTYLQVEKADEGWDCKFVEDPSLSDPGLVDQSFKLNSSDGLQFHKDEKSNAHGLYFAELPIRTKINVCGTNECTLKEVNQLDMVVVRTTAKQFDELHKQAKAYDAANASVKNWNVYFFDSNLKNFQSNMAANVSYDADKKVGVIDWNTVLDRTGVVSLADEKNLALATIDLERPVLVGKYKSDDGKTYSLIGIGQLKYEN